MEQLERLKQLKFNMLSDKINRIKRCCGGLSMDEVDIYTKPKQVISLPKDKKKITSMDLAKYLDDDWDPDAHNKLIQNMFESYEDLDTGGQKPQFSDDSDLGSILGSDQLSCGEESNKLNSSNIKVMIHTYFLLHFFVF